MDKRTKRQKKTEKGEIKDRICGKLNRTPQGVTGFARYQLSKGEKIPRKRSENVNKWGNSRMCGAHVGDNQHLTHVKHMEEEKKHILFYFFLCMNIYTHQPCCIKKQLGNREHSIQSAQRQREGETAFIQMCIAASSPGNTSLLSLTHTQTHTLPSIKNTSKCNKNQ